MRDLAKGAGLSVAAAYHHFESKQALLQALFEEQFDNAHWFDEAQMHAAAAELRESPRVDALASIIEGMLERLDAHADFVRLVHVEVLHGDPDANAVSQKMWREWATIIRTILSEAGMAKGQQLQDLTHALQLLVWGSFLQPRQRHPSAKTRSREARRLAAAVHSHELRMTSA